MNTSQSTFELKNKASGQELHTTGFNVHVVLNHDMLQPGENKQRMGWTFIFM